MKIEKKKFTAAQIAGGVIGGLAVGAMLSMPMWFIGSGDEQGSAQDKQTQTQSQAVRGSVEIANDSYVSAEFEKIYEAPGVEGVFYVSLNVQNKTDKTIWVYLDKASVNKESVSMVSTGVPLYIAPGNSGQNRLYLSNGAVEH